MSQFLLLRIVMMINDPWFDGLIVLSVLILITLLHILWAALKKVKLNGGGPGFDSAFGFSDDAKKRLEGHYKRIEGTLGFWKNQAALYERMYRYAVLWSILSGVLIPVFIQEYSSSNLWARVFLTVFAAWTGLIVALNRGFKAEELFRKFRQSESEFYDIRRRLLDRPETFGGSEEERLSRYFEATEKIRIAGRDAETSNFPTTNLV